MTKLLRHKYFLVGSKCWAEASKGVRAGKERGPHNIAEPTLSRHRDEEEPPNIIATSSQYVTRLRLRLSLSRHCRCASKWLIKTFLHITSISTLNLMAGSTRTHQNESGRERGDTNADRRPNNQSQSHYQQQQQQQTQKQQRQHLTQHVVEVAQWCESNL